MNLWDLLILLALAAAVILTLRSLRARRGCGPWTVHDGIGKKFSKFHKNMLTNVSGCGMV